MGLQQLLSIKAIASGGSTERFSIIPRKTAEDFAAELARNAISVEGTIEPLIAKDFFVGVGRHVASNEAR